MNNCQNRICPCNKWINCNQYKDIYTRKWKHNHDKQIAIIDLWYRDFFKVKYEYPDGFGNG